MSSRVWLASSRRVAFVGFVIVLGAILALRATPEARSAYTSQAQSAQPAPADPLKLSLDVPTLLLYQVKAPKAADFEAAWSSIVAGLKKSEKPDVKAFGEALKFSKVDTQTGTSVLYVFQLDQPSKTISYNPVKLLYETGPFSRAEADAIYEKLKDAYENIQIWPLKKIG